MQLKHIKLAGFKSFVDPTKIGFPTNLVGVVGPNGCGKSNVIDAVRWVLGELSAKNLRGESMVDVIFNGTDSRKPSGQCSIELLFDNSSGKIGGEYASFNEISIKRVMTRDAQSTYFINNTKCRRKDVQDIFLGTGLGPSSYAIIEQGMVSKLVSAKPEELRTHIEEAAGVSKYRERRRETESRIKKTKENLSRVNDIRDEIARLIKRLENQANAAEKYNSLKEEESVNKFDTAILLSLQAKEGKDKFQKQLDGHKRDLLIKEAEAETKQSQIDEFRTQNESVVTAYENAQKNFYSIGAEIAKHEANLKNINRDEISNRTNLERAIKGFQEASKKEAAFKDLSPREKELKLNISIIKALEASKNIESITLQIKPLQNNSANKLKEVEEFQNKINTINNDNISLLQNLENSQKESYEINAVIKSLKDNIERNYSIESKTKSNLDIAKNNYADALEKEKNLDNLSPKEKAMHVLDSIINALNELNISKGGLKDKAAELKGLLKDILQIASAQSKSLTEQFLKRQEELEVLLKHTRSDINKTEKELTEHESNKIKIDSNLEKLKTNKSDFDNKIKDIEEAKTKVSFELRAIDSEINKYKLDLRTYEINLENASSALSRADISISDLNVTEYEGMDLDLLENSLNEVQTNISKLGNLNFASPEEYKQRQSELESLINSAQLEKNSIESLMSELVQKSSESESVLLDIRQKQSHFNESLRELEGKKQLALVDVKNITEKITDTRLELKTYEINLDNANEQINKSGLKVSDIDYEKYRDMEVSKLQDNLALIQSKIIRLGAINLAAPDEISAEAKRKEELDIQYEDLTSALDKLSSAIKTIDNETKSMFKNSFDAVNTRIKEVFPKLFGGGFAELTLTDDDPLNAGVVLMARPPGKKNSSISQLSGGEKALTALSLVFSIFELNPAPFCMLDEVDAPLDDLNTLRFINMVEEMSKDVQFIFITHNKVSMEKSDYLMGVTMQEPGVSRLVSVDMNQALEFVES
ncbi:AAA family ATPase [Gammaproteobacteria bacterium]|nr:AAA family ATPase [Gammaproteobacteria bacterium]